MHTAVMQGVDKVHAQVADTLLAEEIDVELNKAIQQFVSTRFGKNNTYRQGFEESQKRRDDLRSLLEERKISATFKETIRPPGSSQPILVDTIELPDNYMFYVNAYANVWRTKSCTTIDYKVEVAETIYYFALDLNNFLTNEVVLTPNQIALADASGVDSITINGAAQWLSRIYATTEESGNQVNIWHWDTNYEGVSNDFTSQPGNFPVMYPQGGFGSGNSVVQDIMSFNMIAQDTGIPGMWEKWDDIVIPGNLIIPVTTDWLNEHFIDCCDSDGLGFINWSADPSNGFVTQLIGAADWPMPGQPTSDPLAGEQIFGVDFYAPLQRKEGTAFDKRIPIGANIGDPNDTFDPLHFMDGSKEMHPIKLVQHDDVYAMIDDPFNKTKYSSPLSTMRNRNIDIYTDDTFIIDEVNLLYLRSPVIVEKASGINCDLPVHTHTEIVRMAVSSILDAISDPKYSTHQQEVQKME